MRGIWRNQSQFLLVLHKHYLPQVRKWTVKYQQFSKKSGYICQLSPLRMRVCAYLFDIFSGLFLGDRQLFWNVFSERDEIVCQVYHHFKLCGWLEVILIIKVRTKRKKRPKTWSLRFDLLTIEMCIWDYKSSRLHGLNMLMSYFYESRSCMWGWDIRYDNRM